MHVYWEIQDGVTRLPLPGSGNEFSNTSGIVVFEDQQATTELVLMAVSDGVPEYSEMFVVMLTYVAGLWIFLFYLKRKFNCNG